MIEEQIDIKNLIYEVGGKEVMLDSDLAKLYPSLVFVVKGGLNPQGTWMNEDVAIEFARWLNPSFAIWCDRA